MRLRGGEEKWKAEDEEKARRLTKVGLWCIQYNSRDRPCMSRVVQMLEGNGDDVPILPCPSIPRLHLKRGFRGLCPGFLPMPIDCYLLLVVTWQFWYFFVRPCLIMYFERYWHWFYQRFVKVFIILIKLS
jgi:hypothetical protein